MTVVLNLDRRLRWLPTLLCLVALLACIQWFVSPWAFVVVMAVYFGSALVLTIVDEIAPKVARWHFERRLIRSIACHPSGQHAGPKHAKRPNALAA
jgi:hypothetical protein